MCTVGEADQLHTRYTDGDYLVGVSLRPENQHFSPLLATYSLAFQTWGLRKMWVSIYNIIACFLTLGYLNDNTLSTL